MYHSGYQSQDWPTTANTLQNEVIPADYYNPSFINHANVNFNLLEPSQEQWVIDSLVHPDFGIICTKSFIDLPRQETLNVELILPAPRLVILREPQKTCRFRYESEFRNESHGYLFGEDPRNKLTISVMLENWRGEAFIRCSLVTEDYEQHFHKLRVNTCIHTEAESIQEHHDEIVSQYNNWTAEFPGLSVLRETKKEAEKTIAERLKRTNVSTNDSELKLKMKKWEVVKLKFEVFLNVNGIHNSSICPPVYSRRIVYQREELSIVKMIKNEGLWTGNEEVCVLIKGLKEISVEDVGIIFFIKTGDYMCWSADARFSPTDSHEKSAIVFKTPRYHMEVTERVNIHVKLYHKRYEEIFSQPVTFTYLPQNGSAYYPKSPPFNSIAQFAHNRQSLTNQQQFFQNQFEGDSGPNESVHRRKDNFNQVQPNIESGHGNYVGAARSDEAQNASYCGSYYPILSQDEINSILNSIDSVHGNEYQNDAISQSSSKEPNLCIKEEKSQNCEGARQNSTEKTIFTRDADGNNALHCAVNGDNINIVHDLLTATKCLGDNGQEYINTVNYIGLSPLHLSVLERRTKAAALLLQFGADPNLIDFNGNTAVHIAAIDKHSTDSLRVLLANKYDTSKRVDIYSKNFKGQTPLNLAESENNNECVQLLKEGKELERLIPSDRPESKVFDGQEAEKGSSNLNCKTRTQVVSIPYGQVISDISNAASMLQIKD